MNEFNVFFHTVLEVITRDNDVHDSMELEENHSESENFHGEYKSVFLAEEKSNSGNNDEEMGDDIREEVATRLANENRSVDIKNTPVVETNSNLEHNNHT